MSLTIGERLKDERVKNNWTIAELCEKISKEYNLSTGKYSQMEGDSTSDFGYQVFIHLAKLFDVSTDYLLGVSDIPSTNIDMKTACKTTGLNEATIKHLQDLSVNNKSYSEVMDIFISSIYEDMLFHIKRLSILKLKREIFEKELLKKYRDAHGLKLTDDNIDSLGEVCLSSSHKHMFKCFKDVELKKHSIIDDDLKKDIEYEEYLISTRIHELVTRFLAFSMERRYYDDFKKTVKEYYHDALLSSDDETALADYILQNKEKVDMLTVFGLGEEESKNGEHYPSQE